MTTTRPALTTAALKSIDAGILDTTNVNRLLDGVVTPGDLKVAEAARAESRQLAKMTRPSAARRSEHQFDSVSVLSRIPQPYKVVVDDQKVTAQATTRFGGEWSTNTSRAGVHAAALANSKVARELVFAIKDTLALQTGAQTAIEEIKDSAETLRDDTKLKIDNTLQSANEAAFVAVEAAKAKAAPYIQAASEQAAPYIQAAAPVIRAVAEKAAPYVQAAAEQAAPVVQAISEKAEPVVAAAKDGIDAAKSAVSSAVEGTKDRIESAASDVRRFFRNL